MSEKPTSEALSITEKAIGHVQESLDRFRKAASEKLATQRTGDPMFVQAVTELYRAALMFDWLAVVLDGAPTLGTEANDSRQILPWLTQKPHELN